MIKISGQIAFIGPGNKCATERHVEVAQSGV